MQTQEHKKNPKQDTTHFSNPGYDFRKLLLGIPRHTGLILIAAMLFAAGGMYLSYRLAKIYVADVILISQQNQPQGVGSELPFFSLSQQTLVDLIQMPTSIEEAKSLSGLDLSARDLQNMISVASMPNQSHLIRISVEGGHSSIIKDFANALAYVTVKNAKEFYRDQLQEQQAIISTEYEVARQQLLADRQALKDFKTTHHLYDMTPGSNTTVNEIASLKMQLYQATAEFNSLFAEYETLAQQMVRFPDQSQKISEIKRQIDPNHPTALAVVDGHVQDYPIQSHASSENATDQSLNKGNMIGDQLNLSLMKLAGKMHGLEHIQEDLSAAIKVKEKSLEHLPSQQMAFIQLLHNEQVAEQNLNFYSDKLQSLQLMLSNPQVGLAIYQSALSSFPLSDRLPFGDKLLKLIPVLALLLGAIFGLIIALFIEIFDSKIRTIKQLKTLISSQVMKTIPEIPFFSINNGEESTLHYIRQIADGLTAVQKPNSSFLLTVTSAICGEGKSCVAYYLAQYYIRLNKKVILLDLDYNPNPFVRNSSAPQAPLESFLLGEASMQEIIAPGEIQRIEVGQNKACLNELMKTGRLKELLATLKGSFDIIIIDAPGIFQDDYAIDLAKLADECLFVAGSSLVTKGLVRESLEELKSHDIIPCGVILNKVLPAYIEDPRILNETTRYWKKLFRQLFSKKQYT